MLSWAIYRFAFYFILTYHNRTTVTGFDQTAENPQQNQVLIS
jgi:hypothetical protein